MTWNDQFLALFDRCVAKFQSGNHDWNSYYTSEDLTFLASIGYKTREFFDFIEDYVNDHAPSPTTALLIAAVRRDYFLVVDHNTPNPKQVTHDELPTFGDTLNGIAYLPRIIKKAQAKLTGTLHPDMMFGCGGDRNFLSKNGNIHPADFLRHIWASNGDDQKILTWIKQQNS